MDYQYDVFFSYKRDIQSDGWHREVMEKLRFWLQHYLEKPRVDVFFDTEDIRTGIRWRAKLVDALKRSRAIVCVWSPLYFQSQWCVSEWKTFMKRETDFDRELVLPASFIDGESFPPEAKAKQIMDFSDYTSTAARFWETSIAVDFENRRLKPFAKDVAALVRGAPPFTPDFPVVEVPQSETTVPARVGRISDV